MISRNVSAALIGALGLFSIQLSARADDVAVNLMAYDLKPDPMLGFELSTPVKIDRTFFALPPKNSGECWDSAVSVRSEAKSVSVKSLGGVDFLPPFEMKCPEGISFNLAASLNKKDDDTAKAVATKAFKFIDALGQYVLHASSCSAGGVMTTSGLADPNSDPLFDSITEIASANAKLFTGGVKKDKNTVSVQGGEILKSLGVSQVSCTKKADGTSTCQVTIPNTQKPECLGAKNAATDTDATRKNAGPSPASSGGGTTTVAPGTKAKL